MGSVLKLMPARQQMRARELRNHATPTERKLWRSLRPSQLEGYKFGRQNFIEAQGYRVLRFWNVQVRRDIDIVVNIILAALRSTQNPPPLLPGDGRGVV